MNDLIQLLPSCEQKYKEIIVMNVILLVIFMYIMVACFICHAEWTNRTKVIMSVATLYIFMLVTFQIIKKYCKIDQGLSFKIENQGFLN